MHTHCTATHQSIATARARKARAFYLGLCALGITVAASAGGPNFVTFDVPGAGTGQFQGTGCEQYDCYVLLNDLGEITGYYVDANNVYHGFIRSPEGEFTTFDAPGADTTQQSFHGTFPSGINDAGAITGSYTDSSGGSHGFLRSPEGAFLTFDVKGSMPGTTSPIALNLEGAIVGYYLDQNSVFQSFLRKPDGSFESWSGPGQCETSPATDCFGGGAVGINALGIISGTYEDNSVNFVQHGQIRSAQGKVTRYDVPGAQSTTGAASGSPINLFGTIAGYYIDPNNVRHGFLRSPLGTFTRFDIPDASPGNGCFSDCPLGLNDWGAVTGFYLDANEVWHGFLRNPEGQITSFDAPGADLNPGDYNGTYPYSINDAGVITGSYQDSNNTFHGFIMFSDGK